MGISIQQLAKNMQAFNVELNTKIAILTNQETAIKANQNQLLDGEDSKGNEITPSYVNDGYAKFKNQKNPRPGFGTPDVNNTGEFFSKFFMDIKGDNVLISSASRKLNFPSIQQYGKDIFGIQRQNLPFIRAKNTATFIRNFKKQVFK